MAQTQTATSSGGESFAALFEESLKRSEMRSGEVITAEVVRVDYNFVVVNAGLKSEAYVPIDEFKNDQGELEVQVGDFVSVAIDAIENGYGDTILSRDKAKRLASWLSLENSLESGEFVTGTVNGKVKGGLTVLVNGIRAFLPGSLLDTRPVKDMSPFEGKTMEFKVIKLDRKRNNVVLSRRAVVEASMGEERGKLLSTLHEGAIVNGVVKNVTASKIVSLGDEVEVMVLEIDEDKRRISLGMKQCKANPWEEFSTTVQRGDRVKGPVKSITDFGVFVGLAAGIDGLVHLSDLSWHEPGEAAVRNYKKGQEVEAIVLAVDVDRERISLGIKQLDSDPFTTYTTVNDRGMSVTGKVKTVDARGAEIELNPDVTGYLRASEISRDRVEDARNVLKEA